MRSIIFGWAIYERSVSEGVGFGGGSWKGLLRVRRCGLEEGFNVIHNTSALSQQAPKR